MKILENYRRAFTIIMSYQGRNVPGCHIIKFFHSTVPCKEIRFFKTQITKIAVAPMISKIHK